MTTQKNTTGTGGNRGNYDYMQLLSEFALVVQDFGWMRDAACRGSGIDFFPKKRTTSTHRRRWRCAEHVRCERSAWISR